MFNPALERKKRIESGKIAVSALNEKALGKAVLKQKGQKSASIVDLALEQKKRQARLDDLGRTRDAIKKANSYANKDKLKFSFFERNKNYLVERLDKGKGKDDEIISWCLVYLCDAAYSDSRLMSDFLRFTTKAIQVGVQTPSGFQTNLLTFLYDKIKKWADKQYQEKKNPRPDFDVLVDRLDSDAGLVHDAARAEVCKLNARIIRDLDLYEDEVERLKNALVYYERAEELYPDIKVKTEKNAVLKRLESLIGQPATGVGEK